MAARSLPGSNNATSWNSVRGIALIPGSERAISLMIRS